MDQDSLLNLMFKAFGDTPKDGLWFHFRWQADTELGVWGACVCVCVSVCVSLLRTLSLTEEIKGERTTCPSSEEGKVRRAWPPRQNLPSSDLWAPGWSPHSLREPGLC